MWTSRRMANPSAHDPSDPHRRHPPPRPRRPDRPRPAAGAHRRRLRAAAAVGAGAGLPDPPAHHPGAAGVAGVGPGRVRAAISHRVAADAGAVPRIGRRHAQDRRVQPPEDALRPRAGRRAPLRQPGPGCARRAGRRCGASRADQSGGHRPVDGGHLSADGVVPARRLARRRSGAGDRRATCARSGSHAGDRRTRGHRRSVAALAGGRGAACSGISISAVVQGRNETNPSSQAALLLPRRRRLARLAAARAVLRRRRWPVVHRPAEHGPCDRAASRPQRPTARRSRAQTR